MKEKKCGKIRTCILWNYVP